MYNFSRIQSRDYAPQPGPRSFDYYRPVGSFWGRIGTLFPAIGPGASLFGLIRSLGVLLAIFYVAAPQYVAGLNPQLVQWLSWSAIVLIIFPLLRHIFVIVWSASGILMWLVVAGVLLQSVKNHSVSDQSRSSGASFFNWPLSIPNVSSLLAFSNLDSSPYRNVAPPSPFQYDREGNQLRYVSFDDEDAPPAKAVVVRPAEPRSRSYLPSWLFSAQNKGKETTAAPWHLGGSGQASNEPEYDYEALVKKYNRPSVHNGAPSWAVSRPNDNLYFPRVRSPNGDIDDAGIGDQVLDAGQDMAVAVERLARQTLGK